METTQAFVWCHMREYLVATAIMDGCDATGSKPFKTREILEESHTKLKHQDRGRYMLVKDV